MHLPNTKTLALLAGGAAIVYFLMPKNGLTLSPAANIGGLHGMKETAYQSWQLPPLHG